METHKDVSIYFVMLDLFPNYVRFHKSCLKFYHNNFFCPVTVPRSCLEWRQRGYHQKGPYIIDPDGLEGEPPFEVECIMTADQPTIVLNHDQPRRHHVVGFEDPGSYKINITYSSESWFYQCYIKNLRNVYYITHECNCANYIQC